MLSSERSAAGIRSFPNTGHDYRLKNLFGRDLRGGQGIYGASYQKKPYVLAQNLLEGTRTEQPRSSRSSA